MHRPASLEQLAKLVFQLKNTVLKAREILHRTYPENDSHNNVELILDFYNDAIHAIPPYAPAQ
jgi:hypothetical protein